MIIIILTIIMIILMMIIIIIIIIIIITTITIIITTSIYLFETMIDRSREVRAAGENLRRRHQLAPHRGA